MFSYLIRRILLSIPTLIIVSWVVFALNKCAPVDPVVAIYGSEFTAAFDPEGQARNYHLKATKLGLDRPAFYFTVTTTAYPDTLYRVFPPARRNRMAHLSAQTANWPLVEAYDRRLSEILRLTGQTPDSLRAKTALRYAVSNLELIDRLPLMDSAMYHARIAIQALPTPASLLGALDSLEASATALQRAAAEKGMPVPAFYWHGLDNQYHRWMTGFFTGELGTSLINKRPVHDEISGRLFPTLALNGLAILLAYLISIPLGMRMARYHNRPFDRRSKNLLLTLYAFPVFWLGSLLILAFATPDQGLFLIKGVSVDAWIPGTSFWWWLGKHAGKLILPVFTLLIHILAILALQMRSSMLEVLDQEYIKTARAKGLDEKVVYRKHALKNALFPLITIFGGVFPVIFSGSLVIEYLFNYPGMGSKTQSAFMNQDYPVLYAILMISAALTILGSLVADMLYAWVDPRVGYEKR
ncbi:MAG: ABC transporter permease [Saprospiraceae bacterium]|nr:ABC transporter permease [Saprospiraceae bacterium]